MIDWEKFYNHFINKCRFQIIPEDCYTEKHHIKPIYMGGGNDEENLVVLTLRQHVLAHYILFRAYGNIQDHIVYRMRSGQTEEAKEKAQIGQRKWFENATEEEIRERFKKQIESPTMLGVKRPGKLSGNWGKSKGSYEFISPDGESLFFESIRKASKYIGVDNQLIIKYRDKGVVPKIVTHPKFKLTGWIIKYTENKDYGKDYRNNKK